MNRVLILNSREHSVLATTRSLGEKGVDVFTADDLATALAGNARFSIQYFTYPSHRLDPE